MNSILVIEDEAKVARFIQRGLAAEGWQVDIAITGDDGLQMARERSYDLLTIDLLLPGIDGFSLIRKLREEGCNSPMLILSAKDSLKDKLLGFDIGADDYLPKPFMFEELVARIRALMRRRETLRSELKLKYHDLEMDIEHRTVTRGGKLIELSPKEYNLLEFFLHNPEKVLSRARIGEEVWKEQFERESNVVEVYMMYLRKKIDAGQAVTLLQTARGVGYTLRAEPISAEMA
jgi:DNA-binding response OmpR family regulator